MAAEGASVSPLLKIHVWDAGNFPTTSCAEIFPHNTQHTVGPIA